MTAAADPRRRPDAPGRRLPGERRFGRLNALGFLTLCKREVLRFSTVWTQTLMAPLATALLFLTVFSLAVGPSRGEVTGVAFLTFLAPGVVMMQVVQNAFANASSSLMIAKVQGSIVDTLMPPLSAAELVTGYVVGSVVRGLAVAATTAAVMFPFTGAGLAHWGWALVFVLVASVILGLAGLLAALTAEKFDQMAAITNFVVTPLSFLSGTFYSVEALPGALKLVAYVNPVFYLIDGFRFGTLGVSDVSPWIGLGVTSVVAAGLARLAWLAFDRGWKLKP